MADGLTPQVDLDTISQVKINGTTYDICDAKTRTALWDTTDGLIQKVNDLQNSVSVSQNGLSPDNVTFAIAKDGWGSFVFKKNGVEKGRLQLAPYGFYWQSVDKDDAIQEWWKSSPGYSTGSGAKWGSFEGWLNWDKVGQICLAHWWFKCPSSLNTYSFTGNIFSGLPASITEGTPLTSKIDNTTGTAFLSIGNTGNVTVTSRETSISSGQVLTGSGVYICNP